MGLTEVVRSARNPRLQAIRGLRAGRDREHLLLEGDHLLEEALSAGAPVQWALFDPADCSPRRMELLARAEARGVEVVACERRLLDEASDLSAAPGLLAWGPRPSPSIEAVLEAGRAAGILLVAAGLQDPGNVGALVRVAAGLGAGALVSLKGGASPWHPRALRGASGTTFRLPVADRVPAQEWVAAVKRSGCELWAASARGEAFEILAAERAAAGARPLALMLGEEGGGVAPELAAACSRVVGIPLQRGVESLNVATAAAVLLYALGGGSGKRET